MNKPLTPLELQLQQYAPDMFTLHMLMKDVVEGGGGEKKIVMLIDALTKYNVDKATGAIMIDYSRGRISTIDARVRVTADTKEEKQEVKTTDEEVIKLAQKLKKIILDVTSYGIR